VSKEIYVKESKVDKRVYAKEPTIMADDHEVVSPRTPDMADIRALEDTINKARREQRKPFGFVVLSRGSEFVLVRAVWHLMEAIRTDNDPKKASIVGTYTSVSALMAALKNIKNGQPEA
jgi:hypothetical protein